MKRAPRRRSFWQYNQDNWMSLIIGPFTLTATIVTISAGAPVIVPIIFGASFAALVIGNYIDWIRLG